MCCGGGPLKMPPRREPYVDCPDGATRTFAADAWLIAQKNGVVPCSLTGTGLEGLVTRRDVLRALGREV